MKEIKKEIQSIRLYHTNLSTKFFSESIHNLLRCYVQRQTVIHIWWWK